MTALVLGSSGYLGRNLVAALRETNDDVVLVSRRVDEGQARVRVNLSLGALEDTHPLFALAPSRVFVVARPEDQGHEANRMFCDNLQRLFLAWCDRPALRAVHFMSTTIVYAEDAPLGADEAPVAPRTAYTYFKLETELFLRYLHEALRKDVDFRVWRLPIAFGGSFEPEENANQFIYWWLSVHRQGHGFHFNGPEDDAWGTSWFYVPDFVGAIARMAPAAGYRIKNAASGFFTYRALSDFLVARMRVVARDVPLFRTRLEVRDEMALPQRDVRDEIAKLLDSGSREIA